MLKTTRSSVRVVTNPIAFLPIDAMRTLMKELCGVVVPCYYHW